MEKVAVSITAKDRTGLLRDIAAVLAGREINITYTQQFLSDREMSLVYMELEGVQDLEGLVQELSKINGVQETEIHKPFEEIYGKRVIVIGGGAQVSQVALGAITEADRHNIRGERISVDTIPLVGEKPLSEAVKAVGRLHRAVILVLAGSIMGGEVAKAVEKLRQRGIKVVSLNMAGGVPKAADLVVTDPVQAGVMSVMSIADTAEFDIKKVRGKRF